MQSFPPQHAGMCWKVKVLVPLELGRRQDTNQTPSEAKKAPSQELSFIVVCVAGTQNRFLSKTLLPDLHMEAELIWHC